MPVTSSPDSAPARLRAQRHSACFVCGRENPNGLRISFEFSEHGEIAAVWTPGPVYEGFRGIVHGGVVCTVLDEAMSKAVAASGCEALTAQLTVRFRRPVRSGAPYSIRGWIVRRNKRLIETEATLCAAGGAECARAAATFMALPRPGAGSSVCAAPGGCSQAAPNETCDCGG